MRHINHLDHHRPLSMYKTYTQFILLLGLLLSALMPAMASEAAEYEARLNYTHAGESIMAPMLWFREGKPATISNGDLSITVEVTDAGMVNGKPVVQLAVDIEPMDGGALEDTEEPVGMQPVLMLENTTEGTHATVAVGTNELTVFLKRLEAESAEIN